jgi:hypothetical protein
VQCPSPIGTVRDLRGSVLATVGGRPRTNANETEKETGPRARTAPTPQTGNGIGEPGRLAAGLKGCRGDRLGLSSSQPVCC